MGGGGGGLPKNYSDEWGEGRAKKIGIWGAGGGGGHAIFKLHSTSIHRHPRDRKSAALIWTEDVSGAGFKIFLCQLTNFIVAGTRALSW